MTPELWKLLDEARASHLRAYGRFWTLDEINHYRLTGEAPEPTNPRRWWQFWKVPK